MPENLLTTISSPTEIHLYNTPHTSTIDLPFTLIFVGDTIRRFMETVDGDRNVYFNIVQPIPTPLLMDIAVGPTCNFKFTLDDGIIPTLEMFLSTILQPVNCIRLFNIFSITQTVSGGGVITTILDYNLYIFSTTNE
jgi:hypothetical protein